jgi:hypothetical protein
MVTRKGETSELVTMGHIRSHGCRDLLVYCASGDVTSTIGKSRVQLQPEIQCRPRRTLERFIG